jgi:hypothetical protein
MPWTIRNLLLHSQALQKEHSASQEKEVIKIRLSGTLYEHH